MAHPDHYYYYGYPESCQTKLSVSSQRMVVDSPLTVCRCQYRLYYAKLNGIPSGASWESYCPGMLRSGSFSLISALLMTSESGSGLSRVTAGDPGTPATVNGYNLVKPVTCVTGYLGVYGYVSHHSHISICAAALVARRAAPALHFLDRTRCCAV